MWPRKGLLEEYGGGPLWRRRCALGCSADDQEEEEEEEERILKQ